MDAILTQKSHPTISAIDPVAEVNHRIANSLALLVGMVRMQARSVRKSPRPLAPAEANLMLDGIAARIGAIGQLHRILSHAAPDGVIGLKPYLKDVTDTLVAALSSPAQPVKVLHSGAECMVLIRHVQPIVLILCEIFLNAMKYAHPTGVPLIMSVDCAPATDGTLVIICSDDGVGLPEGFDVQKAGGMGFRVMRGLASEMGADFIIESSSLGLTFRLSLPAGAMAGTKLS
ncbi:MAG TPA: sensor histidine kinase [Rhizomicrobium sp.]